MRTNSAIQVVLADDHQILREGVRALLEGSSLHDGRHVTVVGEARNGPDALAVCLQLEPQVAVLDVSLPGILGLDVALRLRQLERPPAVVMLSMYGNPEN